VSARVHNALNYVCIVTAHANKRSHTGKIELPEAESIRLGERFRALAFVEVSKAAWIPGVLEFLRDYHKRYLLFVASGTPQDELHQIIRRRELEQYFIGAFGSPATKGEILNRIVSENRLEKAEMVFVGDTMTDFHAAMESGVKFIGIAPDSGSPFPISAKVLRDLRRLAEAIGESIPENFPLRFTTLV
jgi:phosphoglycolate phosphatase-like HAD superfamily hydrolase